MTNLEKFFNGDKAETAFEEIKEKFETSVKFEEEIKRKVGPTASLYGTGSKSGDPQITLGGLGAPKGETKPRLQSLTAEHVNFMKQFKDASEKHRSELIEQNRLKLYSIIHANYRPAPAYLEDHALPENALSEKIAVGGPSWREVLPPRVFPLLANVARQCCRLDKASGTKVGSGFRLSEGQVITNHHVLKEPGWLLGNPPDLEKERGWIRYRQLNVSPRLHEAEIQCERFYPINTSGLDVAALKQSGDWQFQLAGLDSELAATTPLILQTDPPQDLSDRLVAVIGHPVSGNAGGNFQDVLEVFADGILGDKRLMLGTIDSTEPLVYENGQWFINHNCSTLGGASGSCLVDALTGVVLGIHCSGNTSLGNRAVPAWIFHEKIISQGGLV